VKSQSCFLDAITIIIIIISGCAQVVVTFDWTTVSRKLKICLFVSLVVFLSCKMWEYYVFGNVAIPVLIHVLVGFCFEYLWGGLNMRPVCLKQIVLVLVLFCSVLEYNHCLFLSKWLHLLNANYYVLCYFTFQLNSRVISYWKQLNHVIQPSWKNTSHQKSSTSNILWH